MTKLTLSICMATFLCVASPVSAAPGDAWEPARQAKSVADAYRVLGIQSPEPGRKVLLEVPDISNGGLQVPVKVTSKVPGTDWIAVFVDRNLTPFVQVDEFSPGMDRSVSVVVTMTQTSKVRAVVRSGGKYYEVAREVKVATDGCDKK